MTEEQAIAGQEAVRAASRRAFTETRLYFVCDGGPGSVEIVEAALRGGAGVVQLRDKGLDDEGLVAVAAGFAAAARRHNALFIVNDRPDLVAACGAAGVHVGQDDLPVAEARRLAGPGAVVGLSTHTPAQFDAACAAIGEARPDQISAGPVWATPTKQGRPAAGLGLVEHAAASGCEIPWFAIGGINAETVATARAAGARRAVVVRAIRDAPDPEAAARELRAALALS